MSQAGLEPAFPAYNSWVFSRGNVIVSSVGLKTTRIA